MKPAKFIYKGDVWTTKKLAARVGCAPKTASNRITKVLAGRMQPENALKPVDKNRQIAALNKVERQCEDMTPTRKKRVAEKLAEFDRITQGQQPFIDKYYAECELDKQGY